MKNRILLPLFALSLLLLLLTACGQKKELVGVWKCELYGSELVVEFTADGKFIDRTDSVENRYRIKGDSLEIYVEDAPESALSIDFKVSGDTLTFGGAEYKRVVLPVTSEPDTTDQEESAA